jgi:hypothetical protein
MTQDVLVPLASTSPAPQTEKAFVTGDEIGRREARAREDIEKGRKPISRPLDLQLAVTDAFGLYSFTTENILAYLPLLQAEGKRCLTVAASGDQVINLLMAGAKEVVCFDNIAAAGEVTALKIQALTDLAWEDAGHFRGSLWEEISKPITFARLRDRTTHPLWDRGRNVLKPVIEQLNSSHAFKMWQITGRNAYIADDTDFDKARQACKEAMNDGRVSFVHADVRELPLLELGQFDVIVLSNILQATWNRMSTPLAISREHTSSGSPFQQQGARLKGLIDTMIWPVADMLTPNGVMMASYTYACPDEEWEEIERQECEGAGEIYEPDKLKSKKTRIEAFSPKDGFTVEEHAWEVVNGEASGDDVAVFVRKSA